jgi:hypothetical protein
MADKSEKVVIWAEVDPRGVVSGVNATNRELDKLNKTAKRGATAAGITAGIDAAQGAYGMIMRVIQMVDRRVEELNAMAVKYSPEAMAANAKLQVAKIESEVAIGQAVGPGVAKGLEVQAAAMREKAKKAQLNAGDMAGGIAAYETVKQAGSDAFTAFTNGLISSMGNESAQGPISAAYETVYGKANAMDVLSAGAGALLNNPFTGQGPISAMVESVGNAASGGIGSARGMPYDTTELTKQTALLEQIAKQTKGN